MIKWYENKWKYLVRKHGATCPIQQERNPEGKRHIVTDMHHLCHNTKWRREAFPLFLNSLLNFRPVSHAYHLKFGSWGKITDYQAQKYEKFLQRHPKIAEWVNCPGEQY